MTSPTSLPTSGDDSDSDSSSNAGDHSNTNMNNNSGNDTCFMWEYSEIKEHLLADSDEESPAAVNPATPSAVILEALSDEAGVAECPTFMSSAGEGSNRNDDTVTGAAYMMSASERPDLELSSGGGDSLLKPASAEKMQTLVLNAGCAGSHDAAEEHHAVDDRGANLERRAPEGTSAPPPSHSASMQSPQWPSATLNLDGAGSHSDPLGFCAPMAVHPASDTPWLGNGTRELFKESLKDLSRSRAVQPQQGTKRRQARSVGSLDNVVGTESSRPSRHTVANLHKAHLWALCQTPIPALLQNEPTIHLQWL